MQVATMIGSFTIGYHRFSGWKYCFGVLFFLLFGSLGTLQGQDPRLLRAEQAVKDLDYETAIDLYEKILLQGIDRQAALELGTLYHLTGKPERALYWFEAVQDWKGADPGYYLTFGKVLQRLERCEEAAAWYERFVSFAPLDRRADRLSRICEEEASLLARNQGMYELIPLSINTEYSEVGPALDRDFLVFSSDRPVEGIANYEDAMTGGSFFDLYAADRLDVGYQDCENARLGEVKPYSLKLNSRLHEASLSFGSGHTEVFFTRNRLTGLRPDRDDEGVVRLQIMTAYRYAGADWSQPEPLAFCSDEFSVMHPAYDGPTQRLYFASDMPGGYGGMDLYVSKRGRYGWGPPVNLGPQVNTEGNEVFPHVASDGLLYFASDGWVGLGGLDLFQVDLLGAANAMPYNLGAPFNSYADDFGLYYTEAGTCGYLVSNRRGGVGADDIYHFKKVAVPLRVIATDAESGKPIPDAQVYVDGLRGQWKTDANGMVELEVPRGQCAQITIQRIEYQKDARQRCTYSLPPDASLELRVALRPKPTYVLEGVIFNKGTGLPVEGATLTIQAECYPSALQIQTDRTGFFELALEPGCCYSLRAEKNNFLAAVTPQDCAPGGQRSARGRINLYLQPTVYNGSNWVSASGELRVFWDEKRALWVDANSGSPAEGTYSQGRRFRAGKLLAATDNDQAYLYEWGRTRPSKDQPIPFLLTILYDYNSASIRPDALPELEKLLQTLQQNPTIVIEVGAHTDARGSDQYNQELSQRRAESVVNWLVREGIDPNRLVAKGYGEELLLNACWEGVNCSEADHQKNRRTEFRVIDSLSD
jgi:outer membrane protein OmpA-like peptidoglycan-associated protein/tetratricopeptide (TPR) repeat protein